MQEALSRGLTGPTDIAAQAPSPHGQQRRGRQGTPQEEAAPAHPQPIVLGNNKAMRTNTGKDVCFADQTGTCTRGKECAVAHTREGGSQRVAAKAALGPKSPCRFFALGTCKLGDACKDLHGGSGARERRMEEQRQRPVTKPWSRCNASRRHYRSHCL